MIDPADPAELERAEAAADDLFALAISLGGSISGEHGIGLVKGGNLPGSGRPRQFACTPISSGSSIRKTS